MEATPAPKDKVLLKDKYPETRAQFIEADNPGVQYAALGIGGRAIISWACTNNSAHFWSSSVNQRTSGGALRGCPYCAGKKVMPSESFKAVYPSLALEWDDGNTLIAERVTPKSNRKVTWRCATNPSHTWVASPKQRTNGNSCPHCASLTAKYAEIASQWHPTLNLQKSPGLVTPNSHLPYWWKWRQRV